MTERLEEKRYCPTCQKKTPHWITRVFTPFDSLNNASSAKQKEIIKRECRTCGTVHKSTLPKE